MLFCCRLRCCFEIVRCSIDLQHTMSGHVLAGLGQNYKARLSVLLSNKTYQAYLIELPRGLSWRTSTRKRRSWLSMFSDLKSLKVQIFYFFIEAGDEKVTCAAPNCEVLPNKMSRDCSQRVIVIRGFKSSSSFTFLSPPPVQVPTNLSDDVYLAVD